MCLIPNTRYFVTFITVDGGSKKTSELILFPLRSYGSTLWIVDKKNIYP